MAFSFDPIDCRVCRSSLYRGREERFSEHVLTYDDVNILTYEDVNILTYEDKIYF